VLDRPSTTALPTDRRIATKQHEPRIDALEIPDRPPRSPLRAAVILDEFTLEAMRLEWKLIEIGPDTWRDELEEDQPEILFIESAWKGNGGRWRRCIESSEAIGEGPLFDLVHWCRERGIPTVFWNKEDPPSFDHFIHAAALFDYVFTTDAGCIKRYRKELGHGRVHTLMFAIQPVIHNPVGTRKSPIESFCFGGTYYNRRHRERRRQIDELLLPALGRGLHIYDRMADSGEAAYRWPRQYADAIQGSLSYRQMVTAYKRYRVFLNVNSVVDSPTMFARRVLEILACGTPVISTYSRGLELALGEEALALVRTPEQADEWMERLLAKAVLGEKMVLHAMRLIFANHTYEKRLRFVLETVGLEPRPVAGRAVTVIGWAEGYAALQPLLASFGCQTHVERDLVLLVREEGPLPTELADAIRALPAVDLQFVPHGEDFGAHLDRVCEAMKSNFVAIMDPDATYGEHYLEDLLLAFEYTDADIVGKNAHYRYDAARDLLEPSAGGVQRAYCDRLARGTLVASSQALKRVRLGNIVRGSEEAFYRESRAAGLIFYASDRFNFARLDGSLSSSPADSAPRSAVAAFSAPDWPSTLAEFVMF